MAKKNLAKAKTKTKAESENQKTGPELDQNRSTASLRFDHKNIKKRWPDQKANQCQRTAPGQILLFMGLMNQQGKFKKSSRYEAMKDGYCTKKG